MPKRLVSNKSIKNKNEADQDVLDFTSPDFSFIPQGRHTYRQEGGYLVCKSCEVQHAVWIGMEKLMVGEDEEGNPIIKTRKELGLK